MINLNRFNLESTPLNLSINEAVERGSLIKHLRDQPRSYLGASLIGDECSRKIQFEWMTGSTFPARVHSIFSRGHFFEAESRELLIEAGFVFETSIEKLGFVAADGLMAGHCDGVILGAPSGVDLETPCVWEHKGLNGKNFRAIERDGLRKTHPRYASQVCVYQRYLGITAPALFTIVNADTCERLHFTVPYDARLAQEASDRAAMIIEATLAGELLPRMDPSLEDFRCGWCPHLERCRRFP